MADTGKRVIVDGVECGRVFLFPRVLGAITGALQPGRMILALFMVVLLLALGRLWDRVTSPSVHPAGLMHGRADWTSDGLHQSAMVAGLSEFAPSHLPTGEATALTTRQTLAWMDEGYREKRAALTSQADREALDSEYLARLRQIEITRPRGTFEGTVDQVAAGFHQTLAGVYRLSIGETLSGLGMILIDTPRALWDDHRWFAIFYGLACLVICAVGGGAIARMAAVHQALEQRLSLTEARDFALVRSFGLVWAKALPIVLLVVLMLVVLVIGVLMRVPLLDIITAILYGLVLLIGFVMAFLLVGYLVSFPLLVPAVAVENCDGADAMQRGYAYVINRPLHALWYWAVALFGLLVGFTLVVALAIVTLNLTGKMFGQLAPDAIAAVSGHYEAVTFHHETGHVAVGNWHERWSANVLLAWQALVICMVAAYVMSYYFSASTIAYLLMRKASDGQEPDEIWRPGLVPGTLAPEPPAMSEVKSD